MQIDMKRGLYIWTQEEVDKYTDLLDQIKKDEPDFERNVLDVRDLALARGEDIALDPGSDIADILEKNRQMVRQSVWRYRPNWSLLQISQFQQFCCNHSGRDLKFDFRKAEQEARRKLIP